MTGAGPVRTAAVLVVVPAHDEQDLLPSCLASLLVAAAQPGVPEVRLLVVADSCRDATADRARAAGVDVLVVACRSAGAARRAGFDALLAATHGSAAIAPEQLWLATTDADSRVPPQWLADQLLWRCRGWDAVAGTVAVDDWSEHDREVAGRFATTYAWTGPEHPHVHGANLGLSGSAYTAIGGFPPLALAEDHALVAALEGQRLRVARPAGRPVLTSARRAPRCPGGFGELLLSLAPGTS